MSTHRSASLDPASHGAAGRTGQLLQIVLAATIGVMLLGGVGFARIDAVHNAAHDVRHSAGFPCH